MTSKKLSGGLFLAILFLFVSCVSHPVIEPQDEPLLYPEQTYIPQNFAWQQVHNGIWRFDFKSREFPLIYHAVKIDLTTPGLTLVCFPSKDTPKNTAQKGKKTNSFAKQEGCVVAINTSPFNKTGLKKEVLGIHIDNKTQLYPPVEGYSALIINRLPETQGLIADIVDSQTPQAFENADFAFGGFFTVLRDGQIQSFPSCSHDSRCGCGISEDGKILYILVAEGELPSISEGLSYPQCAQIFKAIGCDDAMEFDGGGSTELCIDGKSVLSYPTLRKQASSFGFVLFRLP